LFAKLCLLDKAMLYVLSDAYRKSLNIFKVGVHSGSISALKSRYITSMPDLEIIHTIAFDTRELAYAAEAIFKEEHKGQRIVNANGNLSEWLTMPIALLLPKLNCLDKYQGFGKYQDDKYQAPSQALFQTTTDMAAQLEKASPVEVPKAGFREYNIEEIWELYRIGRIITPPCQRQRSEDRIPIIKQYIMTSHGKPSFTLGLIVLNDLGHVIHVVDGQHRLGAVAAITKADVEAAGMRDFKVVADVRYGLPHAEEKELFMALNQAESCPKYILGDDVRAEMVKELGAFLNKTYGEYCSGTAACLRPNIHVPAIVEKIYSSGVLPDLYESDNIASAKDLVDAFIELNAHIGAKLTAPNGYEVYLRHSDGAARKHSREQFAAIMKKIASRATKCYVGTMSAGRMLGCLCRLATYN
jgi:hypothetical protein